MAQQEEETTDDKPKKSFNIKKILMPLLIVMNITAVSAGVALVYVSTIGYESPLKTEEDFKRELASHREALSGKPMLYSLPEFNTNLSGLPKRYIRVAVNLEMLDGEGFKEVGDLGPEARDAVMKIISRKSFYDLEPVQGKLRLKNEIINQVNSFLEKGVVKNVYFSAFAIQ